jgi:hypothetical protein
MSTPEEFEVALVKAQAAIAGLRAAPAVPAPVVPADANSKAKAEADARQPAVKADAASSRARSKYLKPALVVACIAIAFLQYYYIEISLQISGLPVVFTGR